MALALGSKLGLYEILAPVGAGGMGEVYRARDAALGRDVAVKVLPPAFSEDAERLQRFKLEAQATAALNHPNILTIYQIGEHSGSPYIVSELLEGETLRQRLQSGPPPLRKAIDIAVQIARGLAAAHEKGIVHRDLKPENVFLCRDGRVKILDFGLAKLTRPEHSDLDSPTLTMRSEPGTVLGTVGYMSPEQVRGQTAGPTSDLFSFGAILYEMLSGKRAFRGDTAADTMSAILKEDPAEASEVNRQIPPALERIVRHCLEKNPEERFQSARDVAFDLEALSAVSGTASSVLPSGRAINTKLLPRIAVGLAILAAFAGGVLVVAGRGPAPLPAYHRITFHTGTIQAARFAADGQSIIYSASWEGSPPEVFVTRPASPDSRSMSLKGSTLLSVSSNGEVAVLLRSHLLQIAVAEGTLARVPLEGGAPREVLSNVESADWSRDGSTLLIVRQSGERDRLEYPPGKLIYESAGAIGHPRLSPQGDRIAFFDYLDRTSDNGSVVVVDLGGKSTTLSTAWVDLTGLAWSPRGDEVWFSGNRNNSAAGLFAVNLSGREREIVKGPGDLLLFDVARDGRILMGREDWRAGVYALASGEMKERDLSWLDYTVVTDLAVDGKTAVLWEGGEGGGPQSSTFLRSTDGSPALRLYEGACSGLSDDGQRVLCISPDQQLNLVPTGTGEIKTLSHDQLTRFPAMQWLSDTKRFVFLAAEPNHARRVYIQQVGSEQPSPITPEGASNYFRVSHDGQSLAAAIGAGYQTRIYPTSAGNPRPIPGLETGEVPAAWSRDDRYLYCYRLGEMPLSVFRIEVRSGKRSRWKQLSPPDPVGISFLANVIISADEKSYAYSFNRKLDSLYLVDGLR